MENKHTDPEEETVQKPECKRGTSPIWHFGQFKRATRLFVQILSGKFETLLLLCTDSSHNSKQLTAHRNVGGSAEEKCGGLKEKQLGPFHGVILSL